MMPALTESQARTLAHCPSCLGKKDEGCILCWPCWREFKWFEGTLAEFCRIPEGVSS